MERRFASKRDTWLMLIIGAAIFACLAAIVPVFFVSPAKWFAPYVLICMGVVVLLLWVMLGTYYVVADGVLRIHHGPYRWHIALDDIENVEPVRAPWSSPALSMDRLRITYGGGRQIMISPQRKQEFLLVIQQGIGREG